MLHYTDQDNPQISITGGQRAFTEASNLQQVLNNEHSSNKNVQTNRTMNHRSILVALTVNLSETYKTVNPNAFRYDQSYNPRRVLTKPPERTTENLGYDNKDHDYILYVNDYIGNNLYPHKYKVIELLGKGTFGQVVKCLDTEIGEHVAVKVVKNLPAYHNQGMYEVRILKELNSSYDPDTYAMVQLIESFVFRNHLCLVFELLNVSLYELIKQNHFKGLSLKLISIFVKQILTCLTTLYESRIIHCDLKPENILLEDARGARLKVIDFGSACYENHHVYSYIQSRFYRSPEVILGHHYKLPIDIWSLGCIVFELFVGLPLFPGQNQHRMLSRFIRYLGHPPYHLLRDGKETLKFFKNVGNNGTSDDYILMTDEEYKISNNRKGAIPSYREYFKGDAIEKIIMDYNFKSHYTSSEEKEEIRNRKSLIHFINQMLKWDSEERWTPHELLLHPFITGKNFTGNFQRPMINSSPKISNTQSMRYWPFVGTPTEHSTILREGGMMSPLGTSPSSFYTQQYHSGNQQGYYRNYGHKGQSSYNYNSPMHYQNKNSNESGEPNFPVLGSSYPNSHS